MMVSNLSVMIERINLIIDDGRKATAKLVDIKTRLIKNNVTQEFHFNNLKASYLEKVRNGKTRIA